MTLEPEPVAFEPQPDWVQAIDWTEPAAPPPGVSDGQYYLLSDGQIQGFDAGYQEYEHYVVKVLNRAGVENVANFTIAYDPLEEQLALHHMVLWRHGQKLDRRHAVKTETLRRESDLESNLLDGRLTLNLIVDDVQVGDVLDYGFSRKVRVEHWPKDFFQVFSVEWSSPLERFFKRISWPSGRPLYIKNHGTEIAYRQLKEDGRDIYIWQADKILAKKGEAQMPKWHRHWGRVQVSTRGTWASIVDTELEYTGLDGLASRPLRDLARDIMHRHSDRPGRIMAALKYVQEQIRYTGLEFGPHSYVPHKPGEVMARRYGDCKDKATLLAVLLRKMGFDAVTALVDLDSGKALPALRPTPWAFDHMIIRLRDGGKTYWLDATATHQAADLAHVEQAYLHYALPLAPGVKGLERIPEKLMSAPEIVVTDIFDFPVSRIEPGRLTVLTEMRGQQAESFRYRLDNNGRDTIAADYLKFYADFYAGLRRVGDMRIEQDPAEDLVKIREEYEIPAKTKDGDPRVSMDVRAYEVRALVEDLKANKRAAPYRLNHPRYARHIIKIRAEGLKLTKKSAVAIENAQLKFALNVSEADGYLVLDHQLKTESDHIPVDQMQAYAKDAEEIFNASFHTLMPALVERTANIAGQANPMSRYAALVPGGMAALAVMVVFYLCLKRDRAYADKLEYFPVPAAKFILLSLVTFQVYTFFWMWKQWRWVKARDDSDIRPFWRAVFQPFWVYPFYADIKRRHPGIAFPQALAVAIAILAPLSAVLFRYLDRLPFVEWLDILCWPLPTLLMLPFVIHIARLNADRHDLWAPNRRYNLFNFAGLAIGGPTVAYALLGALFLLPMGLVKGSQIWPFQRAALEAAGILEFNETVVFYQGSGFFDPTEDGSILTGGRALRFTHEEDGSLTVYSAKYEDIVALDIAKGTGVGGETDVVVHNKDGSWFRMELETSNGVDRIFVQALRSHLPQIEN